MGISTFLKHLFGRSSTAAQAAQRRGKPRLNARGGMRVLVIDDSSTIVSILRRMLQQNGYLVSEALDAEKGVEAALADPPDLIFLDIVLPGMNGFAVLRALRHDPLTRQIPIVMISGNQQATEQFYVQRFGADDFMKKPFGRSEVFARIQHLTQTGRLVVRERTPEDMLPAMPEHTEAEHAAIPDIAMPDPHDVLVPSADDS
jgi:DNA-binding response OmpR family regulator